MNRSPVYTKLREQWRWWAIPLAVSLLVLLLLYLAAADVAPGRLYGP